MTDTSLQDLIEQLRAVLGDDVCCNEPLKTHTSFEIGGPAQIFVTPPSVDLLAAALDLCNAHEVSYLILGKGSDLLVSDEGFSGAVISLTEHLTNVRFEGTTMYCESGVDIRNASAAAAEQGLSGFEFACGIPGSIGGGCFMNAGAYGGCFADVLRSVEVLTPKCERVKLDVDELALGYRQSRIADESLIVLAAEFSLKAGDRATIAATMDDLMEQRRSKQPLEYPSAGSTFKRPEGYFAGKLISDAGLKGYQVGGAAVSEKHAGFVVNLGGATAADVHAVINHVQDEVQKQFGVKLEPEVRFIG